MLTKKWWLCLVVTSFTTFPIVRVQAGAQAVKTEIVQTAGQWVIHRDGKPYMIHGGGGWSHLEQLVAAGGNSIRTWGVDEKTPALLDEAHRLGVSVTLGIWLGHERHGFDYSDPKQVEAQLAQVREAVMLYKDHPALLMWGVGNEMEGDGTKAQIWQAVNDAAKLIKSLDKHHPTMTVIAQLGDGGFKSKQVHRYCDAIDVLGINSYGGASTVAKRYREADGKLPYVVTEHGPLGHWESPRTEWDAPIEMTSTQKAAWYREGYERAVIENPAFALGSYAFLWGHKQEVTATWYGMLLPDGTRMAAVDVMQELWTGKAPEVKCPEIVSLTARGEPKLAPGGQLHMDLMLNTDRLDELTVQWEVRAASTHESVGGDYENGLPSFPKAVTSANKTSAVIRHPGAPGGYRVFAYIKDGQGRGAVANVPIWVEGVDPSAAPVSAGSGKLSIYGGSGQPTSFSPSGYMGMAQAIRMDTDSSINPRVGDRCLEVVFDASTEWGGVVWLYPGDDWGQLPDAMDLGKRQTLSFWARGKTGTEVINAGFGLLGADKPYPDSGSGELSQIRLTSDWRRYELPIGDQDLSAIKSGFYWSTAGREGGVVFYLDDISFE